MACSHGIEGDPLLLGYYRDTGLGATCYQDAEGEGLGQVP